MRALSIQVGARGADAPTLFALPAEVRGGQSVTLAWSAPGADAVTLTGNGTSVDTRGQVTSGALTLHPLEDTTYTLTAGSQTVSAAVTVLPTFLSAQVSPPAALVGDTVSVQWSVAGAERLVLSSMGRGTLLDTTDAARIASGTFDDVVPSRPQDGLVTYELVATRGAETLRRTLTLLVNDQLQVARLDAPAVALTGSTLVVQWTTIGAARIELSVDGQTVFTSSNAALVTQGATGVAAAAQDFTVELVAISSRGDRARRQAQVEVLEPPTTATLAAAPTSVTLGTPVTLTWTAPGTRSARIVDDRGFTVFSVTGAEAEGGEATVYPTRPTTTWTLTADNQLGSAPVTAQASATVTGGTLTLTQWPPTAFDGQRAEYRAPQPTQLLSGFAHDEVLFVPSANFIDISRSSDPIITGTATVTSVTLPFQTLVFGDLRTGPLTISRAGWIAWGATQSVNTTNGTLPSTSSTAYPGIIAPFWGNNTSVTGVSAVYAQVVGDAPEQRLVVQWQGLRHNSNAATELTFEVQITQAGVVSFHYQTMQFDDDSPPDYVVGLQNDARDRGYTVSVDAPPASDSSIYFFTPVSGVVEQRATRGGVTGGFMQLGTAWVPVTVPMHAVRVPFDLAVTEAMLRPGPSLPNGQYLELSNTTGAPLDLSGWSLGSGPGRFDFPAGTVVPPFAPLLVGASTDGAENEDAGVTLSWAGFALPFDGGQLTLGTDDGGAAWALTAPADGGTGVALEFDPGPFLGTTPPPSVCAATRVAGSQLGSPGTVAGCAFRYVRESARPNFRDISTTGTPIAISAVGTNDSQAPTVVTLAATAGDPAPFIFGARAPTLSISPNGWLSARTITATGTANKTTPNTTEPVGVIAPFWDDLGTVMTSAMHWQRLEASDDPNEPRRHWIVQWSHFSTDTAIATPDDLTFQVKLFENGDLEFHYATLQSGTSASLANGNQATVWIDNGSQQALPISVNAPSLTTGAAFRFAAR